MELLSLMPYVAICAIIVALLEPRPAKPSIPEKKPHFDPDSITSRSFSWEKPGITKTFLLSTSVQVRSDSYKMARDELMQTAPSKTYMCSELECFDIARTEILHSDFGAFNYELNQVANYLKRFANAELISDIEFAGIILSFTQEQCIPYNYDKDSTGYPEYFRFPIETIYDTTGDCDCKAILACALFKTLGFRVAFALLPGHAAMLITLQQDDLPFANFVWQGKRWFFCETTGDYWSPGHIPDGMEISMIEWQEI